MDRVKRFEVVIYQPAGNYVDWEVIKKRPGIMTIGVGSTLAEACGNLAFMLGDHHALYQHGAETYEIYRTEQADTDRFPQKWPKVGWYWERGVPSTTLIYKQAGPFKSGAEAFLNVLEQGVR